MSGGLSGDIIKAAVPAVIGAAGFLFGPTLIKNAGKISNLAEKVPGLDTVSNSTDDLSEEARLNRISRVFGREKEELRITSHIHGGKGIIFIIGGPGTGKTALVKHLALRIFKKEITGLEKARILSLNFSKIFPSGILAALTSTIDGGVDDKMKKIVAHIKKQMHKNKEKIILYIDEIQDLFENAETVFDNLKVELGEDVHIIAATTHRTVVLNWLKKRPMMKRRSLIVETKSMSPTKVLNVLQQVTPDILEYYLPGKHTNLQVEESAMRSCIIFASLLHSKENDPDRSITLYKRFLGIYAGYFKDQGYKNTNLTDKQVRNFIKDTEDDQISFQAIQQYGKIDWQPFSMTTTEDDSLDEKAILKFSGNFLPQLEPANADLKMPQGIIDKSFTIFTYFNEGFGSFAILQCPLKGYLQATLRSTALLHSESGNFQFFSCSLSKLKTGYRQACSSQTAADQFLAAFRAAIEYEPNPGEKTSSKLKVVIIEDGEKLIEEFQIAQGQEEQDKKPVDLFGAGSSMGAFGALTSLMKIPPPSTPNGPSLSEEKVEQSPIDQLFIQFVMEEKIRLIILKHSTTPINAEQNLIKIEPNSKEIMDWLGMQLATTSNPVDTTKGLSKLFHIISFLDLENSVFTQNRKTLKEDIAYAILEKIREKKGDDFNWKNFHSLETDLWEATLFSITSKIDRSTISLALQDWDKIAENTLVSPIKAKSPVEIVRKPAPKQNFMYVIHNIPLSFSDTLAHFNSQPDFKIPLWIAEDDIATSNFRKVQIIAWMRQQNRTVEPYDPSQIYTSCSKDNAKVLLVNYFEVKDLDGSVLLDLIGKNYKIVFFCKKSDLSISETNLSSSLGSIGEIANSVKQLMSPSINPSSQPNEKPLLTQIFSVDIRFLSQPLSDKEGVDFIRYVLETAAGEETTLQKPIIDDFSKVYVYIGQKNSHTNDGLETMIRTDLTQISSELKKSLADIKREDVIQYFSVNRQPVLKMSRNQITYSIDPKQAPYYYRIWRFFIYPIEQTIIYTQNLIKWIYKEVGYSLASFFGLGSLFKTLSSVLKKPA